MGHLDAAVLGGDHAAHDGEPYPGAGQVPSGGVRHPGQQFEDAVPVLAGDPRTVVGDLEDEPSGAFRTAAVPQPDPYQSALVRAVLDRIVDEVDDHVVEALRGHGQPGLPVCVDLHAGPFAFAVGAEHLGRLFHGLTDLDLPRVV